MGRSALPTLLAILALALGLRVFGLSFGLDADDPKNVNLCLIDERGMAKDTLDGLTERTLDPRSFLGRGPAGYLVFLSTDALCFGLEALFRPGGWSGALSRQRANPSAQILRHRILTILAALATIVIAWRLMQREFGAAAAHLAALFLASAYLHVRESHFGEVDVLWGLMTLWAIERAFVVIRDPSPRNHALAGLVAGLAAATKYFSVLLGFHLLVAHGAARAAARARGVAPPPATRLLWALGLTPVGFFLVFPGVLGTWDTFLQRLFFSADTYGAPGDPWVQVQALLGQARFMLGVGLGEPVFLLALVGLVLAWRRGVPGRFLTLSVVGLVPTLLLTQHHPLRFGVALLVALALPAGLAASALLQRLPRAAGAALVVLAVAPSVVRSLYFDRLLTRQDTRLEMLAVVEALEVPREELYALGWHHGIPARIHPSQSPFTQPRAEDRRSPAFLNAFYARRPRYVMIDWTLPWKTDPAMQTIEAYVRQNYREVLALDGRLPGSDQPLPDPVDGRPTHMVPYARPWDMTRPGPPLTLFERRD